mmetsp:Transcript_7384/g.10033  ORF Transcript_7384/g.10033 Transcript_7384/m.10033 type:complete len:235 (-) Transcript_7384:57-761(-)
MVKNTLLIIVVLVMMAKCNARAKKVLAIQAANAKVEWQLVESQSNGRQPWSIEELELTDFGNIMASQGFQSALDASESKLLNTLAATKPDALLVSSKGLGILTFLVTKGLWRGPVVLLSPIPNECDHVHGKTWESQWLSTLQVLTNHGVGPLAIGVGTSLDEQTFIVSEMEQNRICGNVLSTNLFELCPLWFLYSFPGDHGWKNRPENAKGIAVLIDIVFYLQQHVTSNHREQL